MKRFINSKALLIIATFALFASCKKSYDGPSIDDYYLNYDIKEIPVTQNYTVGAIYYSFGSFNPNIVEVPAVGRYSMPGGKIDPAIMNKHIEQASSGGVDYFMFSIRSYNMDHNNYLNDSMMIATFLDQNTSGKMNFALIYNFNPNSFHISASVNMEDDADRLDKFINDFERFAPFFKNAHYQKVNGKILLYINNSNQLYSANNPAIYQQLRERLSKLGFDMYLVGYQERWSPPARYQMRFKDGVDAVYEQSYGTGNNNWDRWYLFPQMIDQNWEYSRKYFLDSMNISFVPNISPAYNWKIQNPSVTYPSYPRTDSGAMYRKLCNVAKMNADNTTRLVVIDSWNNWVEDSQLEPAESYGTSYLDITKMEFKK